MADTKLYITQAGLDELNKELNDLIHVQRPQVIVELQEARAQGDLSENADYDAARDRQARVEARIREIEATIASSVLVEAASDASSSVGLGSVITIYDLDDEIEETYTIVGSVESDPTKGLLSNVSPLAQALMDKKVGDIVHVKEKVEIPYKVKIIGLK